MKIEKDLIIAIDPAWAKPYGVVIFENKEPIEDGLIDMDDLFYELEFYCTNFYSTIIIEEPYLGMNVKTLKKLSYSVGAIIMAATVFDTRYELIKPMDWKPYFALSSKLTKKVRQEIKNQVCPKKFLQKPDIQDAYLIGRYYIENKRP